MPSCFCTSSGCLERGGVNPTTRIPHGCPIDARTLKAHKREDEARRARQAQAVSKKVVDDEVDDISAFISSLTLADKVSCSSQNSGRMWAKLSTADVSLNTDDDIPCTRQRRIPDSRKSRIDELLRHLSSIDSSVRDFMDETTTSLKDLDLSAVREPSPFPLKHLYRKGLSLRSDLDTVTSKEASVTEFKRSISLHLDTSLEAINVAKHQWNDRQEQARASRPGNVFDTDHHFQPFLRGVDPVLQLSIFTTVACSIVLDVSTRGCHFIFSMLKYIVQLCLMRSNVNLGPRDQKILSDFPVDIRSATDQFRLDGRSTIFAVCPNVNCHRTHRPTFLNDSPIPLYPTFCNHRQFAGGKRCKTRLVRPRVISGVEIQVPIKTFVAFDFKDWVANLVSRPGYEDVMDAAWNRKRGDEMHDIFDGHILREFKGADGKHFSLGGDEGRYVFSLCVDFFSPFTNKQAGKKCSVGIVSLLCLNLPPDVRYKPENMFLAGIIPGPREPPLDTLNHYLTPLVDDLLLFWQPGIHFSKTFQYPNGRLVRCALVALVCDIPAARKASGFAACSHQHFCSVCHCTLETHGYANTQYRSWKRRTNEECRASANEYRSAQGPKEQLRAFTSSGVRWSELLRLPYFDPARFVVVDAMHNLFLGLIKEHFVGIIGIKLDKKKIGRNEKIVLTIHLSDVWRSFSANEQKSVKKLINWLQAPLNGILATEPGRAIWQKKFNALHERVLRFACNELHCQLLPLKYGSTTRVRKADWAAALLAWRATQPEQHDISDSTSLDHGHIITPDEMKKVQRGIRCMVTPSWMTSVPTDLGAGRHGKLKADQWRVLGTTHLPVSLIQIWTNVNHTDERSERCAELLDVTLSLLSAIVVASSRVTSPAHSDLYLQHMQAYLEGVRKILPDYEFHPNHHMALHLCEYLLFYGPIHAWWTFPFERLVGMLQRIPTNNRFGELEETMGRSFTRSANLRGFVSKAGCPQALKNCQPIFRKLIDPQLRNTLITDIASFSGHADDEPDIPERQTNPIPSIVYNALCTSLDFLPPRHAELASHLTIKGITYAVASRHLGNSCILILKSQMDDPPYPAQIKHILRLQTTDAVETFIAVQRYKPNEVASDPYIRYPALQTKLWSQELFDELEIITPDDIHSHFAACEMVWDGYPVTAVISLYRG